MKSSFAEVSQQIIAYNNNVLELLSKMNELTTSDKSSVSVNFTDDFGTLQQFNIPSIGYLKSEINRLNNNLNTLYSIDTTGSLIQTGNNKFKKIITIDLNQEPSDIESLPIIQNFRADKNWFFDSLMNPMLNIELDLTDRVDDSVKEVLVRRYIVDFNKDLNNNLTSLGQSALNSFNENFRNKTNISIDDFEQWYRTTPGVVSPLNPNYDQSFFKLEPKELLYDGVFSVLSIEEDTINRRIWYHLDTIEYLITETNESQQVGVNDEFIINTENSSSRYKVLEVSTTASNPRVRLERVEGNQPIPVGVGTLKIYSPIINNKRVKVSLGYDERNVVFIKALNANTNIIAKNWSSGVGYYTNDLTLESNDTDNGISMEQFYTERVFDYGSVLNDLVAKKIPDSLAGIPNSPILNLENFKVVQINRHLTDNADSSAIKSKYNRQLQLKSELQQLDKAIIDKNKQLKVKRFTSNSAKAEFDNEIIELKKKKESTSNLMNSVVGEIVSLKNVTSTKIEPKYRVRGFWAMPEPIFIRGARPQEVVQFEIQYRYLSKNGNETPTETFKIQDENGNLIENAAFSNWIDIFTDARERIKDEQTGQYIWQIQDVADADTPNINQLDISIQSNERVEIRVRSISEVGYPDSPIKSEWSDIITVEFPTDLESVLNDDEFILQEATQEELKASIVSDLSARGLDEHLSDSVEVNNTTYFHTLDKILSGFRDSDGRPIDAFEYIQQLTNRITTLEEKLNRAQGKLKITILRNNEESVIKNGSEITYNIECEDYLEKREGDNIPTGRVYTNDIYTIKDFLLRIENIASESPLGLLSDKSYYTNSSFFNPSAPQSFWVNDRDELIFSNTTGNTRTQLNNQFIWSVNFDTVDDINVTNLSDNIGNGFVQALNNSITNILSSTSLNLGYSDSTILQFNSSNNSLIDMEKWVDVSPNVASNNKLLTTIHPSVPNLQDIVENNSNKVKVVDAGIDNALLIPINIYFKMNSLDPTTGSGNNYEYINLNNNKTNVRHIKKVKFFLENEAENRPFIFTIKFNINRSKTSIQKVSANLKTSISPKLS